VLAPREVAASMEDLGIWWGVAGGWALDLWLGRVTREHHDIEVSIRRRDQRVLHDGLSGRWELRCLDPPSTAWRPWLRSHTIEAPAFQVKAVRGDGEFDVFLETVDDDEWVFRRDDRVRRPRGAVLAHSDAGYPLIAPEVQLLYMAKSREAKNEADFDNALRQLDRPSASWLADALTLARPDHPWLTRLTM
jgi:hypothetical protein